MPTFADPKMNRAYMRWYMREYRRKHQAKPKASRPETAQPKMGRAIRTTTPLEIREAVARWKKSGKPEDIFIQQGLEKGYGEDDLKRWLREA